ncbi:transmembrane protein 186-like [Diadema antillarum]|uniref:transmembrane protein 186-like n=1 Tax=Diadema antillarum TaxID=105358 RepID=UPI003A88375A
MFIMQNMILRCLTSTRGTNLAGITRQLSIAGRSQVIPCKSLQDTLNPKFGCLIPRTCVLYQISNQNFMRCQPVSTLFMRHQQEQNGVPSQETLPEFIPFYRLPSIVGLRVLSRVKIAQTCLTLAILPPLGYYHSLGVVATWQLQFCIGTATFALFMLYAMSFYLRRVIGAMYMHKKGHVIKVSHLSFWGTRQDLLVPVNDIVPLGEGGNKEGEIVKKLERYSTKQTLYYTLRYGRVINPEAFEEAFGS